MCYVRARVSSPAWFWSRLAWHGMVCSRARSAVGAPVCVAQADHVAVTALCPAIVKTELLSSGDEANQTHGIKGMEARGTDLMSKRSVSKLIAMCLARMVRCQWHTRAHHMQRAIPARLSFRPTPPHSGGVRVSAWRTAVCANQSGRPACRCGCFSGVLPVA